MAKQVSVNLLKKEVDIYNEHVDIPVNVPGMEDEFIIKLYPYFKPEKVRDVVKDLAQFYTKCKDEKIPYKDEEHDDLVGFFIVKHFTNLKMSKSNKAKKVYEDFKVVINTDIFKFLMDSIPEESIEKVYSYMYEVIESSSKLETLVRQKQQEIENLPLKSRDILFPENKPLQ